MSIIAAFMVPHPPMIIPQVGKGGEKQVRKTTDSYMRVAGEIAGLKPDTIIISSPHSVMYSDYFHISPGKTAHGSFSEFGAPDVRFDVEYDTEFVDCLSGLAADRHFPAGTLGEKNRALDHGTMVPLYFIMQKYRDFRLVRTGLSGLDLPMHYEYGMMIRDTAERLGRRVVYIASGDLSHKLQSYGPYGFAEEGPEYDARIMDVCGNARFGELFDFSESFCEKAAECGHRSFVIMAGALDGVRVKPQQLSHEDVTGVGYGICTFYPDETDASVCGEREFLKLRLEAEEKELTAGREKSDVYVRLARASAEYYVKNRKVMKMPDWVPPELLESRSGVFVSVHKHDRLRGCIGTFLPTRKNLAEEIIQNAVSAVSDDPRFDPVEEDELKWLDINVDVLSTPEQIESKDDLDVKKYGVIVQCGSKRGLLLPDLDGVDTVDRQISIAMRKANIAPGSSIDLYRFEVVRHV
ncbi:MAG: AmmeMemoRadiSam system protein A [Lachnospiraceae bacterium]|nr:AmmeMemoRadiSam system protein A [Lachnospiraceae bacterium]